MLLKIENGHDFSCSRLHRSILESFPTFVGSATSLFLLSGVNSINSGVIIELNSGKSSNTS